MGTDKVSLTQSPLWPGESSWKEKMLEVSLGEVGIKLRVGGEMKRTFWEEMVTLCEDADVRSRMIRFA